MTEQEFRLRADAAIDEAEQALLPLADEADFEIEKQNGVLQLVFDEPPTKFVVSPNAPVRQIWVSALGRSYKLSWSDEFAGFALTGEPLNSLLARLARELLAA